jgi:hypothetical protein
LKLTKNQDAAKGGVNMVPQSISTNWDESSWAQATQWYENCINNHKTCNLKVSNPAYIPSRLLDLNDSPGIKLVETRGMSFEDSYATLSHCWGGVVPVRLLEGNIIEFKTGIPIGRLPKTFVHAIEVARRLKFRYLWIDSLCIIQDSEIDWRQESMLMAEVYSNALLNIAATASRNGNGGLFPSILSHCDADAWWAEDRRISTQFTTWATYENGFDLINSAPLNRRAWVLQERLLSPRVLHFAQSQMFWECEEILSSQVYPDKSCRSLHFLPQLTKVSNKTRMLQNLNRVVYTYGSEQANAIYRTWQAWVKHYSAAAITKPSDKLVAISALPKILNQVLKDTYVAGLWRDDMPRSLIWHRISSKKPAVGRLEEKRAPTWSWAALDCPVDFRECPNPDLVSDSSLYTQLVEIKRENNKLQQRHDEAGRLVGGELRLCGDLYQVKITRYGLDDYRFLDAPFRRESSGGGIEPDIALGVEDRIVTILPIYWEAGGKGVSGALRGLVLQPVPEQRSGWYERVGYFEYGYEGSDSPTHDEEASRIASSNTNLFLSGTENELIII